MFGAELHVCNQRITSVLFCEICIARLLFYPSSVRILLLFVILAAEDSRALELCSISSLFRSGRLFMGWYLIPQLDFLTKLGLTVFWKSHYFSRGFCEYGWKRVDCVAFFWRSFGNYSINRLDFLHQGSW